MALSWPLPLAQFFDMVPIQSVSFQLATARTFSQTGGGDLIAYRRDARLWKGEIKLDKDYHHVWAAIEARLALLEGLLEKLISTQSRHFSTYY
ncbi:MAG: hypothetical protein ACI8Q6_001855 [Granulosicoccus sp.]|jgi:hypothetical protein